jgi:hypothetical protein
MTAVKVKPQPNRSIGLHTCTMLSWQVANHQVRLSPDDDVHANVRLSQLAILFFGQTKGFLVDDL